MDSINIYTFSSFRLKFVGKADKQRPLLHSLHTATVPSFPNKCFYIFKIKNREIRKLMKDPSYTR